MSIEAQVAELLGKTLKKISGAEKGSDTVIFETTDGEKFLMRHIQECCECVQIEDICGNVTDLTGTPLVEAEKVTNLEAGYHASIGGTWTFYKLKTVKGAVTIRWLGESSGFYSESVDFVKVSTQHDY